MSTVTDSQIVGLRAAAWEHGDDFQALICERALVDRFDADDWTGGGHRLTHAQWSELSTMTRDEAIAKCAEVISHVEAQR